jgi:signal transduction histidine kinase
MVQVKITDTGEGIAPEVLPRIFEHLFRAEEPRTRSETGSPGTGLG